MGRQRRSKSNFFLYNLNVIFIKIIKDMSKANSKSLTSLRQKVRKYIKDFDVEVNTYREGPDPVGYSSGAAEDDDDDDNDEIVSLF